MVYKEYDAVYGCCDAVEVSKCCTRNRLMLFWDMEILLLGIWWYCTIILFWCCIWGKVMFWCCIRSRLIYWWWTKSMVVLYLGVCWCNKGMVMLYMGYSVAVQRIWWCCTMDMVMLYYWCGDVVLRVWWCFAVVWWYICCIVQGILLCCAMTVVI